MDTMNYLEQYYNNYDEEGRLLKRYGRIEYITTMKYIHKFLSEREKVSCRILEAGAGTGRYSIALAQEGYTVDSVELVEHNLNILKSKIKEEYHITARQGNVLDLSAFEDDTFDMTLVLGPMYHLYSEEEKRRALTEAIRVTKPKGYIMVAYCMNEATILQYCFMENHLQECMNKNMLTEDFHCISKPEDLFEIVRIEDINRFTKGLNVERIHLVATDGATNYMRDIIENMEEDIYEQYIRYHLTICERQDLIGATNHSLDILRKE